MHRYTTHYYPFGDGMTHTPVNVDLLQPYLDEVAHRGRTMLLPVLHHAQSLYGWLPPEVQEAVSRTLRVPLADIHGVIEFYTMLYNEPTAKRVIRVCEDSACSLAGNKAVMAAIEAKLGLKHGETTADVAVTYEHVPCLGMCEFAPVALDGEKPVGELSAENTTDLLDGITPETTLLAYGKPAHKLARVGVVDPGSLEDYLRHSGYEALADALTLSPDSLIATVDDAAILGRGGAMFPLGRKWLFTRGSPGTPEEKHIVVNADESEPGTFKDRLIMENDPFAIIEAMTIAGYGVGAANGWIFVRGEYPRSAKRLQVAVDAAREGGYLGENILGVDGFNFDVEIRLGAGAYICGEETALFEAIEGKRGFPRIKPPYPPTHGLFGQPTVVNNVETLVAMLAAYKVGKDGWLRLGTEESPGTKLFCLSGHVTKPGVYEVPFGLTIREMIDEAGGVPGGRPIQAVLMGGAAGKFIGPDKLDVPLTYEDTHANDIPLGSGVIMVFDDSADLRHALYELSRFFAHESCGKCFPCQLGTQRQMEIMDRIAHNGGAKSADAIDLADIGFAMTETSLCGLGQTAASAILSAIELWPELAAPQNA
jgi:NADH-quinone oxidoreductase subunit F